MLSSLSPDTQPSKKQRQCSLCSKKEPYWFGIEEEDDEVIASIIQIYVDALDVATTRATGERAPLEFIGCLQRVPLRQRKVKGEEEGQRDGYQSKSTDAFHTLDAVAIYQRSNVPLGYAQRHIRTVYCRTSWDMQEGTPVSIKKIPASRFTLSSSAASFSSGSKAPTALGKWISRVMPHARPSFIYCLPVFGHQGSSHQSSNLCNETFEYLVGRQAREVGYANEGSSCIYESLLGLGRQVDAYTMGQGDEQEEEDGEAARELEQNQQPSSLDLALELRYDREADAIKPPVLKDCSSDPGPSPSTHTSTSTLQSSSSAEHSQKQEHSNYYCMLFSKNGYIPLPEGPQSDKKDAQGKAVEHENDKDDFGFYLADSDSDEEDEEQCDDSDGWLDSDDDSISSPYDSSPSPGHDDVTDEEVAAMMKTMGLASFNGGFAPPQDLYGLGF